MSEPLNDTDVIQPLYACLFAGPENAPRIQVTLAHSVRVRSNLDREGEAYAAWLDVDVPYFKAWIAEVSASLERLEADNAQES